jgi:DNA-binding NarL/FixJ family response regulator
METPRIRIAIVEDHRLFRQSMVRLLNSIYGFMVLFEAANGAELMLQLETILEMPDIILMDVQMPIMNGIEATDLLRMKFPTIKIIILSMLDHGDLLSQLMSKGISGFLTKNVDINIILLALNAAMKNEIFYSITGNSLVKVPYENNSNINSKPLLTLHQKIFLTFCVSNLTYKEIAGQMNISIKTADRYRDDLFQKLNVKNRVELSLYAIRTGQVNL